MFYTENGITVFSNRLYKIWKEKLALLKTNQFIFIIDNSAVNLLVAARQRHKAQVFGQKSFFYLYRQRLIDN